MFQPSFVEFSMSLGAPAASFVPGLFRISVQQKNWASPLAPRVTERRSVAAVVLIYLRGNIPYVVIGVSLKGT